MCDTLQPTSAESILDNTGHSEKRRLTAREKCLQRARKEVEQYRKHGRKVGVFSVAMGLLLIAVAITIVVVTYRIAGRLANLNPAQLPQNLDAGFCLGLSFGFLGGVWMFKGIHQVIIGIKCFRGDVQSQMLVEYHDALQELLRERQPDAASDAELAQSEQ